MIRWLLAALLLTGAARAEPWPEFPLLMWHDQSPARLDGLRRLGFTGVKVFGTGGRVDSAAVARAHAAGLGFYIENIATDFYAPYHRWTPGKPVTWLFEAAKARRRADPGDTGVFVREPGLSDPVWRQRVADRLAAVVAGQRAAGPLFYNLADEAGIGDLAAAWDADIAPESVAGMRAWLHTQYADLDALNRQWGASFASWDAVVPDLTDQALRRTDGNFSAWADFKAWMDVAFADAVRMGTDAVHRADPAARAALEGAQIPGWGGYDYGLLAGAVDVMEIYPDGGAPELARAFNPGLTILRTSFGEGAAETHAAWRSVLDGSRGIVVWDEADNVVRDDGSPGPRGIELQSLAASIRAVLPTLSAAVPEVDGVAVLYSQASFRTQWLLDRQGGPPWSDRDAERENEPTTWRSALTGAMERLGELGIQPHWLTPAMLEGGGLRAPGLRVLVLPHAIALSDRTVAEIGAFAARGGAVLADGPAGAYDEHSRLRPLKRTPDQPRPFTTASLDQAGAVPGYRMESGGGRAPGVLLRRFVGAGGTVVALQATHPAAAPIRLTLRLPGARAVHDVRADRALGIVCQLDLTLDAVEPTILRLREP